MGINSNGTAKFEVNQIGLWEQMPLPVNNYDLQMPHLNFCVLDVYFATNWIFGHVQIWNFQLFLSLYIYCSLFQSCIILVSLWPPRWYIVDALEMFQHGSCSSSVGDLGVAIVAGDLSAVTVGDSKVLPHNRLVTRSSWTVSLASRRYLWTR